MNDIMINPLGSRHAHFFEDFVYFNLTNSANTTNLYINLVNN